MLKGAIIGAPLPLCSCGVIPTALAIRKAGASKGATASFLVATPETGVDSISYSIAVLGPLFAVFRPIGALLSAVVTGILVRVMDTESTVPENAAATGGCGGGKSKEAPGRAVEQPLGTKLKSALTYGYGQMVADTGKWLAIGLVAAAVITTYVPQSFFLQWGDGLLAMLIMVVVGLPMYICATASTPVAASLLFAGISPGAALVFLLTGPATNIATIGVIREHLGTRSMLAYLIGVIATAIVCGLMLNQLFAVFGWSLQLHIMDHGETWPLWRQVMAVVLTLLVVRVLVTPYFGRLFGGWTVSGAGRGA